VFPRAVRRGDVAPVQGTFYGGGSRQLTVVVQVEEA
jgi:hypothetical protein